MRDLFTVLYDIRTRGEGLAELHAQGFRIDGYFPNLLAHTPEPLLPETDLEALQQFLRSVPPRDDRRTNAQRNEAARLLELIEASAADALLEEVRGLLLDRVKGKALLRPGRPGQFRNLSGKRTRCVAIARWVKQHAEPLLKSNLPLNIPLIGLVSDDPDWADLPISDHAMRIAHKVVQEMDLDPPSVRTLRNQLSK